MSKQEAISVEEFRRLIARKPGTLGGPVDDGDSKHKVHSRMVRECGNWLNGRRGVLVWATGTGRWTGKATFGTPGVPDLVGWCQQLIYEAGGMGSVEKLHVAQFLAVECKVGKDKLNDAQQAFRREAEAAGVRYFCVYWSGEIGDDPVADLKAQWQENPDA